VVPLHGTAPGENTGTTKMKALLVEVKREKKK
jgi:hypothetical protein